MAMFDTYNEQFHGIANAIETLSGTTPSTPVEIDMQGYHSIVFTVYTGTVTDAGTAAGVTWELSESDTSGSGYTAVADTDLIGEESDLSILLDTDGDSCIGKLAYIGSKRYLKLTATGTAGTDAVVFATFVKGKKDIEPVPAV